MGTKSLVLAESADRLSRAWGFPYSCRTKFGPQINPICETTFAMRKADLMMIREVAFDAYWNVCRVLNGRPDMCD